jgi:hypothetical protein
MEQQYCGKHVNNPFTKGSAPGSISYETKSIRGNQKPQTFSKCANAKCMKIRATRKRLSIVRVHGSLMCLIFFTASCSFLLAY